MAWIWLAGMLGLATWLFLKHAAGLAVGVGIVAFLFAIGALREIILLRRSEKASAIRSEQLEQKPEG